MKLNKIAFALLLVLQGVAYAAQENPVERSLYCVGSFMPVEKPNERTPLDAVIIISENQVAFEIRSVGSGVTNRGLFHMSGLESIATISLMPPGKGQSPFDVSLLLQNYTGELKVYYVNNANAPVIYQAKCEERKSLVSVGG